MDALLTTLPYQEIARSVITKEIQAINDLQLKLDENFDRSCELIINCKGRVIVSGMGKSGHIAAKIAATLSSIGTPAFFMNLGEAAHGDFGMVTHQDVLIIISNSGNINELITLMPHIKALEIPIIAMTGNNKSVLAKNSDTLLNVGVTEEACSLGLAPTTSSTVALVMGDALAVAVQYYKGFTINDYARSHPGGALGKKLLLKVTDLWHTDDLPTVDVNTVIVDALLEMTTKKLGAVCITDNDKQLLGIYTDGDLRRTLFKNIDIKTTNITKEMSTNVKKINKNTLAVDALSLMQTESISVLAVVDDKNCLLGLIHLHDLLRSGIY